MIDPIQIVIALILYLALFGWIGFRRGTLRELITFIVAFGGYFLLQRFDNIVINLINLSFKFLDFARAGGLSSAEADALQQLRDAPDLIQAEQAGTVLFVIWAIVLMLTYIGTDRFIAGAKSPSTFGATLLGIVNGLLFFAILLPRLGAILAPQAIADVAGAEDSADLVLRRIVTVLDTAFERFWGTVDDQQPVVVVLLLTLILVTAASTLRNSGAKS